MAQYTDRWLALMGKSPKRIPHWEPLSNPSFVKMVTGIDPWEKPRSATLKLLEEYPIDFGIEVPMNDNPIAKPDEKLSSYENEDGSHSVRWGMTTTTFMNTMKKFNTIDDVINYDPIEHLSCLSSTNYELPDKEFYNEYFTNKKYYNTICPEKHQIGYKDNDIIDIGLVYYYNTMFMWPLTTFGWELFLELAGAYQDHLRRIIEGFAMASRKFFKAVAKTPDDVNVVVCHDDICITNGPICSPEWLRKFIYPYYEEFFSLLKNSGKRVIFNSDGNIDKVADDVIACGADGLLSEPTTNWKTLAMKYPYHVLGGEGDNRIIMEGNQDDIKGMVDNMIETAKMCGGYLMSVSNHIPWNIPPEKVKMYFDYCREKAFRY